MASHGARLSHGLAALSRLPQVGTGGWMPNPRNDSADSRMMALPTASVAATDTSAAASVGTVRLPA